MPFASKIFNKRGARYTESERIFRVQLWKYNPCYFAREGHVAPVSLVCTFKVNQEERIEMCIEQIKSLLESSRQKIAVEVNTTLLSTYWQIGKIIVEVPRCCGFKSRHPHYIPVESWIHGSIRSFSFIEILICM